MVQRSIDDVSQFEERGAVSGRGIIEYLENGIPFMDPFTEPPACTAHSMTLSSVLPIGINPFLALSIPDKSLPALAKTLL